MSTGIEDYAVIGDGRSVALISRTGDLDWLCLPDLDSPAAFAGLLGGQDFGHWSLTIEGAEVVSRCYDGSTFVLMTQYSAPTGRATVTEWMVPQGTRRRDVVRRVECTAGTVRVQQSLRVRFGYGRIVPWATKESCPAGTETLRFVAGPDALTYRTAELPEGHNQMHEGTTELSCGDRSDHVLTWSRSWEPVPEPLDVDDSLSNAQQVWSEWCADGGVDDGAGTHVRRSLLVLRLLTNTETGGIAAAATTSLPEEFGGVRNWDYRFCWLRDSSLTLSALLAFGFTEEAQEWREWLLRAVAGDPRDLQIMYGIDGRRFLPEVSLDHLPGYGGSRPVRVGNAASGQVQHDVFGEALGALAFAREQGVVETSDSWSLQSHLISTVVDTWREPDHGIWEVRGPKQHFTQSKVMCWYAIDRAVHAVKHFGLPGPVEEWEAAREELRADILARGIDPTTGSFVQHYDTDVVDASLLMILPTGFLPLDDPRIIATVRRIREELSDGPHVKRYHTRTGVDGLPGSEHHFYACSFWLVQGLALIGEVGQARSRFDALLATSNDVELFAEEYDVARDRFAGNFPQALSHLALVQAADALRRAEHGTYEA